MELPGTEALPAIIERYAQLVAATRGELGERPLVLPNGEFFPDKFQRDPASTEMLVERMMGHAGLDDVPLSVRIVDEAGPEAPHDGCSSGCQVPAAIAGTLSRLVDHGDGWTLNVPAFELAHPVVLTTMIARALGHVFLVEALPDGARIAPPVELTADYAAVALGLGPLLLEGAYVYSKGCGGPSVAQLTRANLPELSIVCALFIEQGRHPARAALRELSTTQQALLAEAHELVKSNGALVRLLRDDPGRVARGDYRLSEAKPWLFRLFGKKQESADLPPPELVGLEIHRGARGPSRPVDPEHEELRALVEEALVVSRADAE